MPLNYNAHRVLAIIPVYNEQEKASKVISKFSNGFVDEICLILDAPSKIILNEIINAVNAIDVPVNIIHNRTRKGIGYAIRLGINYAIKENYDIIVVLAGNNKDDPREIPKFLDAIVTYDYDYVQGSRFLPGGYHEKTPLLRGAFIRFYPFIWSVLTDTPCTDVTNGFRAYKTKIFQDKRINIWQQWLDSYELEHYIHYKVITLGYKIREVPVSKVYPHRNKGGYSQINPLKDFWSILRPLFYLALGIRT